MRFFDYHARCQGDNGKNLAKIKKENEKKLEDKKT